MITGTRGSVPSVAGSGGRCGSTHGSHHSHVRHSRSGEGCCRTPSIPAEMHAPTRAIDRARQVRHDGYVCRKCGCGGVLHVDHIVPLSLGGRRRAREPLGPFASPCNPGSTDRRRRAAARTSVDSPKMAATATAQSAPPRQLQASGPLPRRTCEPVSAPRHARVHRTEGPAGVPQADRLADHPLPIPIPKVGGVSERLHLSRAVSIQPVHERPDMGPTALAGT